MRYKQSKDTWIGKVIAAVAWVVMVGLLCFGSLFAAVEDMSVEGLLAAGACIIAATLAFSGLQVLACIVDGCLIARKKAQKKESASDAAPQQATPEKQNMNPAAPVAHNAASAQEGTAAKAKPAAPALFTAAGKAYHSAAQLEWQSTMSPHICLDIYGRPVACFWERFPCFDSYDYLYEDRYYRWYLIPCGENWTVVSTEDGSNRIMVLENLDTVKALSSCRGPGNALHVLADIREMLHQQA